MIKIVGSACSGIILDLKKLPIFVKNPPIIYENEIYFIMAFFTKFWKLDYPVLRIS